MTYTFTYLEISEDAYNEIKAKLKDAEYEHAFVEENVIDMHGIALKKLEKPTNNHSIDVDGNCNMGCC